MSLLMAAGAQNVTCVPGTGQALLYGGPTFDTSFSPAGGTLTLTPHAATAANTSPGPSIVPASGTLRFTSILQPVTPIPATGSLTMAGAAPSITIAPDITPPAGALTLVGYAPTVTIPASAVPGAGALAITGFAAQLGFGAAPSAGALTLTGIAAAVKLQSNASPATGALALAGNQPVLTAAGSTVPAAGTLTFVGYSPSLGFQVTPNAGELDVAGVAPSLEFEFVLPPNSGAMALTGIAPFVANTNRLLFGFSLVSVAGDSPLKGGFFETSETTAEFTYYGLDGLPIQPVLSQYRVDDVVSGANIVPWTRLPGNFVDTALITAEQNVLISNTFVSETHQVLVQVTDELGQVHYARALFTLKRVAGLN